MKKPTTTTQGRVRIARSVSLTPLEDKAVLDEVERRKKAEPNVSYSDVIRFAVRGCYMTSPASPEGRAAQYLEARDRAIEFEEDCASLLARAGFSVERGAKVNGDGHRVDLLAARGRRQVVVELKSSGRRSRLELVLGQAILLKSHAHLPVVVCVPYVVDQGVQGAFTLAGVTPCSPDSLVRATEAAIK